MAWLPSSDAEAAAASAWAPPAQRAAVASQEHEKPRPDITHARQYANVDLRNANLREADMIGTDLSGSLRSGIEGKSKQLSIHGGEWNLPKAAPAKSGEPAREKIQADGANVRAQPEAPNLEEFKNNPIKAAGPILRWRSREKINAVLANLDFAIGLKKLASDAPTMPKAALVLSQLVLRPEYFSAAATAMETAGAWAEPPTFKKAEERRLAAEALERSRPPWALHWLAKALVGTQTRYPTLRLFFASRLILASGGLMGAVDALVKVQGGLKPKEQLSLIRELRDCARPAPSNATPSAFVEFAKSVTSGSSAKDDADIKRELAQFLCEAKSMDRGLLLDEKFVGLVTALDADSGAKLREGAAKLVKTAGSPRPESGAGPHPDQASLIREAAWSDADEALGRALRDWGALDRSFERLESVVDGEAAERTRRAKNASNFVLQWVQQAAYKRSIKALNSVGERVQFDPVYHDLQDDAEPGDYVRVVTPSIVRGDGAQQIVLLRGEVELD